MDPVFKEEKEHLERVEDEINRVIGHSASTALRISRNCSSYITVDNEDRDRVFLMRMEAKEHASKAEKYARFQDSPYFARLDFNNRSHQTETYYIGRNDVDLYQRNAASGRTHKIIDWRTPIGNCYYQKNQTIFMIQGQRFQLTLRRYLDIKKATLRSYKTEFDQSSSETLEGKVIDEYLLTILQDKRRFNRLTDIIRTIQANQNEIIRLPLEKSFVVQGCAGSGKTMILLHRLSTLLYNNPEMSLQGFRIITPNRFFDMHINDLTRELGLDKIQRFSVEEYYVNLIHRFSPDIKVNPKVESEKALPPEMLRKIYSEKYAVLLKEGYEAYWNNVTKEINELGVQPILSKIGLTVPNSPVHKSETWEKYDALMSSVQLRLNEAKKKMKEAIDRQKNLQASIIKCDSALTSLSQKLTFLIQQISERLADEKKNTKMEIDQLYLNLAESCSNASGEPLNEEMSNLLSELNEIENKRSVYTNILEFPSNNETQLCKEIRSELSAILGDYQDTQKELSELNQDQNNKHYRQTRLLQNIIESIKDSYTLASSKYLDKREKDVTQRIESIKHSIVTEYPTKYPNEGTIASLSKMISVKQEILESYQYGLELIATRRMKGFSDLLTKDMDKAILQLIFDPLEETANRLSELQTMKKRNEQSALEVEEVIASLNAKKFSDEEMSKIENLKRLITGLSYQDVYENTVVKALTDLYQIHGLKYTARINYRHKLFFRLMICSLYYSRTNIFDTFINIDEAQDISVAEYRLLKEMLGPRCIFNLYGDIFQTVYDFKGITDWKQINFITNGTQFTLNENYRNTFEITHFSNAEFNMSVMGIGISGDPVQEMKLSKAISWIRTIRMNNRNARCAIIYRYGNKAVWDRLQKMVGNDTTFTWSEIEKRKTAILTVEQAKGIEFEHVVVITDMMGMNEKYISYSRALNSLVVVREKFGDQITAIPENEDCQETL